MRPTTTDYLLLLRSGPRITFSRMIETHWTKNVTARRLKGVACEGVLEEVRRNFSIRSVNHLWSCPSVVHIDIVPLATRLHSATVTSQSASWRVTRLF